MVTWSHSNQSNSVQSISQLSVTGQNDHFIYFTIHLFCYNFTILFVKPTEILTLLSQSLHCDPNYSDDNGVPKNSRDILQQKSIMLTAGVIKEHQAGTSHPATCYQEKYPYHLVNLSILVTKASLHKHPHTSQDPGLCESRGDRGVLYRCSLTVPCIVQREHDDQFSLWLTLQITKCD